jgi:hypothetical protein
LEKRTGALTFALRSTNRTTVDFVAQLVEQYTFNVWALGSSPSGITIATFRSGYFHLNPFEIIQNKGFLKKSITDSNKGKQDKGVPVRVPDLFVYFGTLD